MTPGERANLPRLTEHGFEIWFLVVLAPESGDALWLRYTRFRDASGGDARVWAVRSRRGVPPRWDREILAEDAFHATHDPFEIRIGSSRLSHGHARGAVGSIAWDLHFSPPQRPTQRTPNVPDRLPIGTHATHPCAAAPTHGWVQLDGVKTSLDGALTTQMHLWGTRRVPWLRWLHAPQLDGGGTAELTSVRPSSRAPALTSLWVDDEAHGLDHTSLPRSMFRKLVEPKPGVLHCVRAHSGRRVVVRGWAAPERFAGWEYRQVGGGALWVAQTNQARTSVEVYQRQGLGWRPVHQATGGTCALEVHGRARATGFSYVGWADPREHCDRPRPTPTPDPPAPGEWIETPRPTVIHAFGLTYREHVRETASRQAPVLFRKQPRAFMPGGGTVSVPSTENLLGALERAEPGLRATLQAQMGFLPAMLDYEAELALIVLEPMAKVPVELGGRVALAIANDLSARSVQILGEGQPDRLAYWALAKSFDGFAPCTPRAWVPRSWRSDRWLDIPIQTRVNGHLRQDSNAEQIALSPAQLLGSLIEREGPLPVGAMVLTGTPSGVAFSVTRLQRALGDALLDRFGKLRAALGGYTRDARFLHPGDDVEVRGGFLGAVAVDIDLP